MAAVHGPLRPEEEKLFQGQPKGFPLADFAVEDVMLPEDDDMGIESEDDVDEVEAEIVTESGFGSVIVVDNLPQVPPEKQEKLVGVLRKLYDNFGTIRDGGLWLPQDPETQVTRGFAFLEFSSPREAQAAQQQTNGYSLTKTITFKVTMFDDFEKYGKVPDAYEQPERQPYKPVEDTKAWMLDKRARDQFVVRHGDITEVMWNDPQRSTAEPVYSREFWTESYVQWSPHGSYMATLHRQGVVLWGTGSWARIHRYAHPMVRLMAFSPNERYLVTHSLVEPATPQDKASMVLNVFDTRLGRCLRNFTGPADEFAVGAAAGAWPIFKWAGHPEDQYFARLSKGMISVYEAPDMTLLDKKSIRLDAVFDFAWSPTEPILCAFQLEQAGGNLPARISLVRIPDRTELRQKNLFSVSEVKLLWHPQGHYLAVQVDRYTKTRKTTYSSFELFSIERRDVPMEVLELPNKADKIVDFAWEPKGTRFALLHGEGNRPSLSLYDMDRSSAKGVHLVNTQPNKAVNCIAWSPQGRFLVLGGLKSMQGQLEFFSADDFEVMNAAEHFMCTDIEWDPSGRYVATAVNQMHQMENGWNLWTFNGHLVYREPREKFIQFSWRPRAPSLLSEEAQKDIVKNLKAVYSKRYEEEDLAALHETDTQIVADRQRLADEWQAWLQGKAAFVEEMAAGRRKLLGDALQERTFLVVEAEVEEVLSIEEAVMR